MRKRQIGRYRKTINRNKRIYDEAKNIKSKQQFAIQYKAKANYDCDTPNSDEALHQQPTTKYIKSDANETQEVKYKQQQ